MIKVDTDKCLRCGGCVGVCPVSALELTEHGIKCSGRCTSCKSCVNFCPVGALSIKDD
ncbi:MAG: ferredoxin [Candidatus Aenigmatarchaeota archaeon]|nr:MAG: ferredoxin [Candidatus Aenigmarchaeota archaeon]